MQGPPGKEPSPREERRGLGGNISSTTGLVGSKPLTQIDQAAPTHLDRLDATITNPSLQHVLRDADTFSEGLATHERYKDKFHMTAVCR